MICFNLLSNMDALCVPPRQKMTLIRNFSSQKAPNCEMANFVNLVNLEASRRLDIIICRSKGQLISKCLFSVFNFLQKTNKKKSHSSKIELVRSFFGGNVGLKNRFYFV